MYRDLPWLLAGGLALVACATGGTGTGIDVEDDEGSGPATTGVGADPTAGPTTGVGGDPTTGVGGDPTTSGVGGAPTTTGVGGAPSSSSATGGSSSSMSSSSASSSSSSGTGGGCTTSQIVMDTSFEAGSPSTAWNEISLNFGTPLCTSAGCGTAGSMNPVHTGTWFAWFGGFNGGVEQSGVQQNITIPATAQTATLTYWLEAPVCDVIIDFAVFLDGMQLQYFTEPGGPSPYAGCGQTPNWTQQSLNVIGFADGTAKLLSIEAIQDATFSTSVSNFLVDDVELTVCN